MHNKRVISKIEKCLNYQWANLNFSMLISIFGYHLAEIWTIEVG